MEFPMVKQCIGAIALVLSLGGCASGGSSIEELTKSAGGPYSVALGLEKSA